jgi:hypothetical protein
MASLKLKIPQNKQEKLLKTILLTPAKWSKTGVALKNQLKILPQQNMPLI